MFVLCGGTDTQICTVCSYSSSTDSIQPVLWMNVKQSLSEIIVDYDSDDILEAYMCTQCNTNQRTLVRSEITSSPRLLGVYTYWVSIQKNGRIYCVILSVLSLSIVNLIRI